MDEKWRISGMRLSSGRFSTMTAALLVEMEDVGLEVPGVKVWELPGLDEVSRVDQKSTRTMKRPAIVYTRLLLLLGPIMFRSQASLNGRDMPLLLSFPLKPLHSIRLSLFDCTRGYYPRARGIGVERGKFKGPSSKEGRQGKKSTHVKLAA